MGWYGSTLGHCGIAVSPPQLNSPIVVGGTTVSPTRMGIQEFVSPHGPTGSVEFRNTQIFDTSINENLDENGDSTPIFNKVIGRELSHNSSSDIYLRYRAEFTSNAVGTEAPEFVYLGIPDVNASDKFSSFGKPNTKVGRPTDGSNWYVLGNVFGEVTAFGVSGTRSEQNYSYKTDFETRRENQDFGRQNISMSRPPLDSTYFGTNTTNRKTSPIESIPVGEKTPYPTPLTQQTEISTRPTESPKRSTDSSRRKKRTYHRTQSQTHHHQTHYRTNLISRMIPTILNQTKRNIIQTKSVETQ